MGTYVIVFLSTIVCSCAQNIWITTSCPSDPTTEILLPHEDDCTKYYLCSKGLKVLKQCPEETSFHIGLQGCEWSPDVSCQKDTTVQAPRFLELIEQRLATGSGYLPNGCPSDPSIELLLPHSKDCSKYYQCTHGIMVERSCPGTLHFDVAVQTCTYPNMANCKLSSQPIEETTTPKLIKTTLSPKTTFAPETTEQPKTTVVTESTKFEFLPNGCPADMHSYFLIPHESDCKKYYQCNHGKKVEKECPADLHFDFALQGCNWSNIAKCSIKHTTLTPQYQPTTPELTVTTELITTKSNYLHNGCPKDLHIHQLLPHETDCTLFYQCNHGDKVLKNCPAGLHFDVTYQVCNWPDAANCYNNELPTTEVIKTTEKEQLTTPNYGPESEIDTTQTIASNSTTNYVPTITFSPTTKVPETTTKLPVTSPKTTTEKWQPTTELDLTTHWYEWTLVTETERPNVSLETETETNVFYTTEKATTKVAYETTVNDATTDYYVPTVSYATTIGQTEVIVTRTEPPTTMKPTTTHIPPTYQPTTEKLTTTYRPTVTHEPTTKVPVTTEQPTTYKPTTTNAPTTEQTTTNKPITTNLPTTIVLPTTPQNILTTEDSKTTVFDQPTIVTTEETQTTIVTPGPSPCLPGFFGNMAHPELCNAYYLCSAGLAIPLFCPNGYEFDPDVKICVPIKPGGCTLGGDGTYTTLDPIFTEDANDNKVTENTSAFMTTTTELPTKDVSTTVTETTTTTTTEAPTTTEIDFTTDNPQTTKPPQISCPPGVIELIPNPGECTSYYMCFGGSALIMHCPVGLEYDINSKTCVAIQDGGCTLSGNTQAPTTKTSEANMENTEADITTFVPTTVTLPTTTVEVTTMTDKPITPAICPPGAIASMPNPEECNVYYLCTGGMAIGPLYCPTGQEFDFDAKSCTAIKEGGCTLPGSSTTGSSTSESDYDETTSPHTQTESVTGPSWNQPGVPGVPSAPPSTNFPETTVTEATTTELAETTEIKETTSERTTVTTEKVSETTEKVPETTETVPDITEIVTETTEPTETTETITTVPPMTETPPLCPPSVIVNVPHPEICDAYYLCFSGSAIAMYCPPGQEFDTNSKACVTIKDGGCTYNHAILTTIPYVTYKVDINDASTEKYTKRYKQPTTVTETTVKETTELPRTTSHVHSSTNICGPNDFGHKPHPDMCNAFYMCTGGTAIPLLCAEGLEFDTSSALCEEIKEGGCTYNLSSALLVTPQSLSPTDLSTTKNTEITKKIIRGICNVTDFGYVPHPEKCDSYYMCTGGIAVPLKCQKGYEFNYNSKKCILITTGGCFARKFFYKRTPHIKRQTIILNRWHQ